MMNPSSYRRRSKPYLVGAFVLLCWQTVAFKTWADPVTGEGWPSLASEVDSMAEAFIAEHKLPGMTVAISKDGRVVLNKGYGYADVGKVKAMEPEHRSRIGSTSKVITALAVMHMTQNENPFNFHDFSLLDQPIYSAGGLLATSGHPNPLLFWLYLAQGQARYTPVVGTVIRKTDDRVFTYYDNGTFSAGTTWSLDSHQSATEYSLPPDQTAHDIRGMAAHPSGWIYTWYADRSLSIGTLEDLDSALYFNVDLEGFDGVDLPNGQSMDRMVGIGIGSTGSIYSWWENGTFSVGAGLNLASGSSANQYSAGGDLTPWDLRSMAIAGNDRVYAFYGNNKVSSGSRWNLDSHRELYSTELADGIQAEPWFGRLHQVTLRHLLSHTSGFVRDGSASAAASMFNLAGTENVGMERVHQHTLRARPLLFAPGEQALYSNHGMGVAGWLLEQHSQMGYKDYLDNVLLAPLSIELGRMWEPLSTQDATPHRYDSQGELVPCSCPPNMEFGEARGGLTASAGDLVRLMLATDQRVGPSEHPDVLSAHSLHEMETSHYPLTTRNALGWGKNAGGRLSHTGKVYGGRSGIAKYPAGYQVDSVEVGGVTVAVVINVRTDAFMGALMDSLAEAAGSSRIPKTYDLY